jgi:hypothetical protein
VFDIYKPKDQIDAEALGRRLEEYLSWFENLSKTNPEEAKRVAIKQLTAAGILDKNSKVKKLIK